MPDADELPVAVGMDIPAIMVVDIDISMFILTRKVRGSMFRSRNAISKTARVRVRIVFGMRVFDGDANGRFLAQVNQRRADAGLHNATSFPFRIYGAWFGDEQLPLNTCIPLLGRDDRAAC